jgi:hypothetical protein
MEGATASQAGMLNALQNSDSSAVTFSRAEPKIVLLFFLSFPWGEQQEETGCGRAGLLSLAACPRAARAVSAFVIGVHAYGMTWHVSGGSAGSRKRRAVSVCHGAELKSPCSSWSYIVGPCLDTGHQIHYTEFIFSVTSKCRYKYGVLNIDKIKT